MMTGLRALDFAADSMNAAWDAYMKSARAFAAMFVVTGEVSRGEQLFDRHHAQRLTDIEVEQEWLMGLIEEDQT